jgi:phospholipid-binding lipoprotein MlaA
MWCFPFRTRRVVVMLAVCASALVGRPPAPADAQEAASNGGPHPAQASNPPPAYEAFELEYQEEPVGFPDPLERTNRKVLWFDDQLSRWVIDPIVSTYQFLLPAPVRLSVRRFFLNINSPSVMVNDLLQCEWTDASVTIERFALNSTVGVGGLFDPAARFGLPRHSSDFGQTLALAGVGSGPYIILPLFGPNTARDAFGDVVDFFFQPTLYILPFAQLIIYEGSLGLSRRDAHTEALTALRSSSIDYYSALQNAFYQNRMAEIWQRRANHRPDDQRPPHADSVVARSAAPGNP